MVAPVLPRPQAAMLGPSSRPTGEWYDFFRHLLQFVAESGADPGVIASILARLDEMEQDGSHFELQGLLSVQVNGTPAGGMVQLRLRGDVDSPGKTYRYGTDATGTKGWFAVADAFISGPGIALSVDADGVTEIATTSSAGVLPVVTGEIPPVLVYGPDGSLIYLPVT